MVTGEVKGHGGGRGSGGLKGRSLGIGGMGSRRKKRRDQGREVGGPPGVVPPASWWAEPAA